MIEQTIENNCQNCGAGLTGNYCYNCGQKRTGLHDRSIKALLGHFFEEIFVWDSRFFRSIKYLFIKPGFLTHEYISGRFQSYISPLKMFLFTSFVLFFIMIKSDPDQYSGLVSDPPDSDDFLSEYILEKQEASGLSKELFISNINNQINDNITLYIFGIMFAFSVILKVVYFTKNIYYAEHVVFTLHFFTFVLWSFLMGVITQGIGEFFILLFLYIVPGIYLLISLKAVYHRTVWKAVIVGGFLTFCYWCLITIWVFATVFLSALRA
jgi:Protein of unknown function (DUF3667)